MTGETTQAELADCIGMTRQSVIAIERGTRYAPSRDAAFRTADAFRAPINQGLPLSRG